MTTSANTQNIEDDIDWQTHDWVDLATSTPVSGPCMDETTYMFVLLPTNTTLPSNSGNVSPSNCGKTLSELLDKKLRRVWPRIQWQLFRSQDDLSIHPNVVCPNFLCPNLSWLTGESVCLLCQGVPIQDYKKLCWCLSQYMDVPASYRWYDIVAVQLDTNVWWLYSP